MAESNIKVSKDIHNDITTEEVKSVKKTEDSKETNNDSTISLKSFKIVDDDKHRREDQSKIDDDVKTNRNQNYSEDIQEEVSAPKCCNCIYEVGEFLPWFCINIGRWCSNSFKRNCCCNKKVKKKEKKRGALYEEDEEYWDGDLINEGDLTRYSLPVCVDDDGDEDNCIKIRFHRNEGFDAGDDIKIENVESKKCDKENRGDLENNKESEHEIKTDTHYENNRSSSQRDSEKKKLSGNVSHAYISDLQKCNIEYKGDSGWSKKNDHDTKTVTHGENNRSNSQGDCNVPSYLHGNVSNDYISDLKKCDVEITTHHKEVSGLSKENYHDNIKTVTQDNNHNGYGHKHSDVPTSLKGVSGNDYYNYYYEHKDDIHMSKGSDHDTKTVTQDNKHHGYSHKHSDVPTSSIGVSSNDHYNYFYKDKDDIHMSSSHHDTKTDTPDHSYGHGHSDLHSSSHDFTSDSHVSHDNTYSHTDTGCSGGDTGYSGGDTGGCDTGGSDW